MNYAIEACETNYQGLHGIVSYRVVEDYTYREACELGHFMSEDLIYSYGLEPVPEDGKWDWNSDEECADAWNELIMYYIWEIPDFKEHTVEELDEMFYNDPDGFVKEYCIEADPDI